MPNLADLDPNDISSNPTAAPPIVRGNINNIDPEWTRLPYPTRTALEFFDQMAFESDYIVAHNASFDRKFIEHELPISKILNASWICTKNDFKWPVHLARNRLQDVCNAMGVPYVDAHRALTDCHFLADCFSKVSDLQERFNLLVR